MRKMALAGLLAMALAGWPGVAGAAPEAASPLALPHFSASPAGGTVLAQRAIEREWGPAAGAETATRPPGWRSESASLLLSAVLPGSGQLYNDERSGWWYALAEAAAWTGWWVYQRDARRQQDRAAVLAGDPRDPESAWSFARWSAATQQDPEDLAELYHADPRAFLLRIARDPRYLAGWRGADAWSDLGRTLDRADDRLVRARRMTSVLWLNHLVAAVDALRAARLNNLPLAREAELRLGARVRGRQSEVTARVERRW